MREKVSFVELAPGEIEIQIKGELPESFGEQLAATLPASQREEVRKTINRHIERARREPTPYEQGAQLAIPNLCINLDGDIIKVDSDTLLLDWNLLDYPARLAPHQFDVQETAHTWEIDLNGTKVVYSHIDDVGQQTLDVFKNNWTELALVRWLDKQVRQTHTPQTVSLEFCRKVVEHLLHERNFVFDAVIRGKFLLAKAVSQLITDARIDAAKKGYQALLLAPNAPVEISFNYAFKFNLELYTPSFWYKGAYQFKKHLFGPKRIGDLKSEGEEFDCAQALDTIPEIKYWVRNLERQKHGSFWLPTSTDRFYPDFVAELTDGRVLVVEYKGAHLVESSDTKEKLNIGEVWATQSVGKCLFMIAEKSAGGLNVKEQVLQKLKKTHQPV